MNTKNNRLKKHDKIEIDWIDSFRQHGGWVSEADINFKKDDERSKSIHCIGYFIKSTSDNVYLAQQRDGQEEEGLSNIVSIPHGCVLKIRKLK